MIRVTRLNGVPLVLNADLIEMVEITPDTVVTLTTGEKLMVKESAEQIIERATAYRRSIFERALACPLVRGGTEPPGSKNG